MPDTLEDDLRRALAAGVDAIPESVDLAAASRRRRRQRRTSRLAAAVACVVILAGGLLAWRMRDDPDRTETGPVSEGASGIHVTLPDGHAFTVHLPPGDYPTAIVTTSGWVGIDGCCPDANVQFEPASSPAPHTASTLQPVDLGSWTTASGLHLRLQGTAWPFPGTTAASDGATDLIDNHRTIVGEVGDYRLAIEGLTLAGIDLPTARAATDDLAISIGPEGYPVIGTGSRRGPYEGTPDVTAGPGVVIIYGYGEPDPYGMSARLDLGTGQPSVRIQRSDCRDGTTTTRPSSTAGLQLASASRCFPDSGVLASAFQASGGDQAAVDALMAALRIDA